MTALWWILRIVAGFLLAIYCIAIFVMTVIGLVLCTVVPRLDDKYELLFDRIRCWNVQSRVEALCDIVTGTWP